MHRGTSPFTLGEKKFSHLLDGVCIKLLLNERLKIDQLEAENTAGLT